VKDYDNISYLQLMTLTYDGRLHGRKCTVHVLDKHYTRNERQVKQTIVKIKL